MPDGRRLIYYDVRDDVARDEVDARYATRAVTTSEVRYDPLRGEWVLIAAHRQGRTYQPPSDECPLCPSPAGHSEIMAAGYDVVVFENRFPSLTGHGGPDALRAVQGLRAPGRHWESAPSAGRCEVMCFSSDHEASFADLPPAQVALVLAAWTDRTAELSRTPGVEQVFLFEDRGKETGMSLVHPHGQIYAYPFVTPRTERVLAAVAAHRDRTGRNLFDDLLATESRGERVVIQGRHWTAFVPNAAHWPYEVHLYPRRRVPDLTALDDDARAEFPDLYLDLLRRFDRLFGAEPGPVPYISAWLQAPVAAPEDFALHLELFTVRRSPVKLKHLAGSELLMDVYVNEIAPEAAAARLRELG
nr:galactose-1-phosphate uridylyltransferase [Sphaerisporangium rubeum]